MTTGAGASVESLLDDFEAAVKEAAYSDCSPMGDPGNYYKHMERDESRKALLSGIDGWKRALSNLRGRASTCLALDPTPEQMRRALERISGDE